MIKFITKSFILILLVFLGLCYLNKYFTSNHFFSVSIKDFKKQENIDLIIFGNSHAHFSYDPRIFENKIGINTFNLSAPAQSLLTMQSTIDLTLKDHNPSLAIVDIFSLSLREEDSDKHKSFQLETLDHIPCSIKKIDVVTNVFPFKEWLTGMFTTIRYHSNWKDLLKAKSEYQFPSKQDYYKGFASYNTRLDDNSWNEAKVKYKSERLIINELSSLEKNRINQVIQLFNKKNIPILFLNAPDHAMSSGATFKSHSLAIKKYITSIGEAYIDLNDYWEEIGLQESDFRDFNHLNVNGAIKTSAFLAKYIEENFKFNTPKKPSDLDQNRYSILDGYTNNLILNYDVEDEISEKIDGINKVQVYEKRDNLYEVILHLDSHTISSQKIRWSFDFDEKDFELYHPREIITQKNQIYFYSQFTNDNVVTYNEKYFLTFTFYCPLDTINNVFFYAGEKRNKRVFDIKNLKLQ